MSMLLVQDNAGSFVWVADVNRSTNVQSIAIGNVSKTIFKRYLNTLIIMIIIVSGRFKRNTGAIYIRNLPSICPLVNGAP